MVNFIEEGGTQYALKAHWGLATLLPNRQGEPGYHLGNDEILVKSGEASK